MDEFVAFSHSFWRFVLGVGRLERSGSQSFHESSVQRSIIQSAGDGGDRPRGQGDGCGGEGGGQPLVYCKSHVVDILVAQVEARRVQVRGQGSATGTGMTFVDKINIFLSDLPVCSC